ncbi:MAG: trypsin-like serine protease [Bacteriovoracaceae bacterium]|nr:trypsin-like serine protease [Bacteriovoracaceae bacterium]
MKKNLLILFGALALSGNSYALMGDYLSSKSIPKSICKLDIQSKSVCTGTLIAPDTVLTAAHCVDSEHIKNPKKPRVSVRCGRKTRYVKSFSYPDSEKESESRYLTKTQAQALGETRHWSFNNSDMAILKLKKPFPYEGIEVVESFSDLLVTLETSAFCGVFGAGTDNYERVGTLRVIDFKPFKQSYMSWEDYLRWGQQYLTTQGKKAGIRPGDSGGPVSCRDTEGNWRVLSVHQSLIKGEVWLGKSRPVYKDINWILEKK